MNALRYREIEEKKEHVYCSHRHFTMGIIALHDVLLWSFSLVFGTFCHIEEFSSEKKKMLVVRAFADGHSFSVNLFSHCYPKLRWHLTCPKFIAKHLSQFKTIIWFCRTLFGISILIIFFFRKQVIQTIACVPHQTHDNYYAMHGTAFILGMVFLCRRSPSLSFLWFFSCAFMCFHDLNRCTHSLSFHFFFTFAFFISLDMYIS